MRGCTAVDATHLLLSRMPKHSLQCTPSVSPRRVVFDGSGGKLRLFWGDRKIAGGDDQTSALRRIRRRGASCVHGGVEVEVARGWCVRHGVLVKSVHTQRRIWTEEVVSSVHVVRMERWWWK